MDASVFKIRNEYKRSWRSSAFGAFTLVELVVVIAILAVLAGLVLPALTVVQPALL
jgi:prepilin-type N-terminal cleavage/methylation domain-containing protein